MKVDGNSDKLVFLLDAARKIDQHWLTGKRASQDLERVRASLGAKLRAITFADCNRA